MKSEIRMKNDEQEIRGSALGDHGRRARERGTTASGIVIRNSDFVLRETGALRRAGFTLIELLTVITVVGLLAAMLAPAVSTARERARRAQCRSTLRQIGTAMLLHVNEQRGALPSLSHLRSANGESLSWTHTLTPYLGPTFLGRCPSRQDHPAFITYGWNDLLADATGAGLPYSAVSSPSQTMVVGEIADNQLSEHLHFTGAARNRVTPAYFLGAVAATCHGPSANYLYADGHVRSVPWFEVQTLLARTSTPFLYP